MTLRGFVWLGLLVTFVVAALAPAPAMATTTFGMNLNRTPDDGFADCTTVPGYGYPTYSNTCTAYSTISTTENAIVPEGEGTITQARVRAGSTTGTMQFAVGRAQQDFNKPADQQLLCCAWRAAGPEFTPARNAVTPVTLNEAVRNVRDFGSNQAVFDVLAISVLQPGVPVPATAAVNEVPGSNSSMGICWPAVQRGNAYCQPGGAGNYAVLINADWEPSGGGGGADGGNGGADGGGAGGGAGPALATEAARVKGGTARLPIVCELDEQCFGDVLLQNAATQRRETEMAPMKMETFARGSFAIPAGDQENVKVFLTKRGAKLLKRRHKATVWANIEFTTLEDVTRTVSSQVTLKR